MPLHIPSKTDLKSKLDNLQSQAKKKYIDLSSKLLVFSLNSVNHFARHLIILKGKDPDYVPPPPPPKAASPVRPSFNFGGSSRGWTKDFFKNPEDYHPILINRIKVDKNGLKSSNDPDAEVLQRTLQRTLVKPIPLSDSLFKELVNEEESFLNTLNDFTSKTVENESDKVEIVSGSRAVSKEKKAKNAAKKKVQSVSKKTTKVKKVVRVKKGVIHRVED